MGWKEGAEVEVRVAGGVVRVRVVRVRWGGVREGERCGRKRCVDETHDAPSTDEHDHGGVYEKESDVWDDRWVV